MDILLKSLVDEALIYVFYL